MKPNEAAEILGLNIGEMSALLGIHRETYGKWHRGNQRPPAVAIGAIELWIELKKRFPRQFRRLADERIGRKPQ